MGYYIRVEGNTKIYVEDVNPEGNKTILFLHGWPGSHKLFEYQFNQLPKLGYRCIGIDQRGFGDSDKPFTGYNFGRLSDDVRCVVEVLKLKDFTLLGHSTGGGIAIKYMSRHKQYGVSKLVLVSAVAPNLSKKVVYDTIQGTYNDRPNMLRGFGDIFFFQYITQAFSDWFFQLGLQAASWATAATANTWLENLTPDLAEINVPTLIIQGIHDKVVPTTAGEIQKQEIKNSKFLPYEFSGHGSFYDEKDRFNRDLTKFIEEKS